jgi:conjugative relaxase-like TrwC/TraI family protein
MLTLGGIDEKLTPEIAGDYFQKEKKQFELGEYYANQNSETFYGGLANKFVGEQILEPSKVSVSGEKHVALKSGRTFMEFLNGEDSIDMTYTAPKSVSVITELTKDEELRKKFIQIHNNSACGVMRYVEENLAYTRKSHRENGKKIYDPIYPGKIEYAAFLHHDTREVDPNIHTHFIIPKRLYVRGQKYALEVGRSIPQTRGKNILDNKIRLGEYYRALEINQFRQNDISVKITDYKHFFFEIEGVEQETLETFSKRSEQIKSEYEKIKDGVAAGSEAEVKAKIALETRKSKDSSVPLNELRAKWEAESPQQNICPVIKTVKMANADDIDAALKSATAKLTENRAQMSDLDLKVTAMKHLIYNDLKFNEEDINLKIKEMFKRRELVKLDADGFFLTTKEIRMAEIKIQSFAKNAFEKYESIVEKDSVKNVISEWAKNETEKFKKEKGKDFALTGDQNKVLEALLTTKNGVTIIQGDAGTGKTTLLKAFYEITKARGVELAGLSTTGKAVKEIVEQSMIDSKTIDSHILQGKNIKEFIDSYGKKVYIVDESSMNATLKIKEVIELSKKENARVILIGDIKQLASIQAGGMFERLQKSKNVTFVEMHESIRQTDQFLKEAVKIIAKGKIKEGMKMLDEKGKIHVHENKEELYDKITDAFVEEGNLNNFILSSQNKDRYELNKITRDRLKKNGAIDEEDFQIKIREGKNIGDEDKKNFWNYEKEDVVIRGKHNYKIKDVDFENKSVYAVDLYSGKEILMSSNKLKSNQVYIEAERKFSKGDKIIFLKNDYHVEITKDGVDKKEYGVQNGLSGLIKNIERLDSENCKISVDIGKGKTAIFETKDYNYFTHGYAITSYKSQGQTAEKVYIFSDRTTKNEFYVNVSRAKQNIEIFTMDKKLLFKTALKDDKQIDSMTFENKNYRNYSIIENILNKMKKIDTSIPSIKELKETFEKENLRKEYQKPKAEKKEKTFSGEKSSESKKISRKLI